MFPLNRFTFPRHFTLCLMALLGCQSTPHDHRPLRNADSTEPRFILKIQTHDADPAKIQVWVTASDPSVWPKASAENAAAVWESILSLRLVPAKSDGGKTLMPPISGTYSMAGNQLVFQPQFALLPGEKYQVRFDLARLPGLAGRGLLPVVRDYQIVAGKHAAPPRVTAIYPSGSIVPANHLKFYLIFSEPMQTGNIFKYFKLINARSEEVPEPFRETELWSVDGRRLTLWFHPGRQKTGVNLNVEIGPVLTAGERYTLVISRDWPSQRGVPLGRAVEKYFRAGPADHTQPNADTWKLEPPTSARGKLRLTFSEAYDWALLQSQLWVETADGKRVAGRIEIGVGETVWSFTPTQKWGAGKYRLAMGTVLEDLAGNSLARPFEVDLQRAKLKAVEPVIYRSFTVTPVATDR